MRSIQDLSPVIVKIHTLDFELINDLKMSSRDRTPLIKIVQALMPYTVTLKPQIVRFVYDHWQRNDQLMKILDLWTNFLNINCERSWKLWPLIWLNSWNEVTYRRLKSYDRSNSIAIVLSFYQTWYLSYDPWEKRILTNIEIFQTDRKENLNW